MEELTSQLEQCLLHALHVRNFSKLYLDSVRISCKAYLRHSRAKSLADFTSDSVEAWLLDSKLERNWSAATFRSYHRNLNFFFRWLLKRGKITENPAIGVELPKLPQSLPKGLASDQAETLLQAVKRMRYTYRFEIKRNTAVIALMLFTGLRKREVTNLELSDVDIERMVISVRCGKGKKDRLVPISSRLAVILKEYLLDRARLAKECSAFFTTSQYDKPMGIKCIDLLVRRLREKTKIHFSAHALRHTFATLMLEGGCDLYTLSRMMGHSKVTTTTVYLSCTAKMMLSSIEKHPLN